MPSSEQAIDARNISIRSSPYEGNGIYTKTSLDNSDIVASALYPLTSALDKEHLDDTCYWCLTSPSTLSHLGSAENPRPDHGALKRCSGCKVVKYCSEAHAKAAWKGYHRKECPVFAHLYPDRLPSPARAVIRLLLRHKSNSIPDGEWDDFMALESHLDKFSTSQDTERWKSITLMADACKEYSRTDLDLPEVLTICARLLINSFTLMNSANDPLGIYLHPVFARANHSCNYNATMIFNEPSQAMMVPVRPIKSGEEIFVPYIDTTQGFSHRQRALRSRYFFTCTCSVCQLGPTTYRDLPLPLSLVNPQTQASPQDDTDLQEIQARVDALLSSAQGDNPSLSSVVQARKSALHLLAATYRWPLTRQPSPVIRQELYYYLIRNGDYDSALLHAAILHFFVDDTHWSPNDYTRLVRMWAVIRLIDAVVEGVGEALGRVRKNGNEGGGQGKGPITEYIISANVGSIHLPHIAIDLHQRAYKFPLCQPHPDPNGRPPLTDLISQIHYRYRLYNDILMARFGYGVDTYCYINKGRIQADKEKFVRLLEWTLEQERKGEGEKPT